MKRWHCPRCGHQRSTQDDIVSVQHTCWKYGGELVRLDTGEAPERSYEVICGNVDCVDRRSGRTFQVSDSGLIDGQIWVCEQCRPVFRRAADQ